MMMEDRNNNLNINDIDLSLLRLSSPPYSAVSPEVSPLKRSSPVSDESDHPKRRKVSPQNPIFITTSPLLFPYPQTQSSIIDDDPTRNNHQKLVAGETHESRPVQETSSKTLTDTETMKMVNNCVEEVNQGEETNYAYEEKEQEEEEEEEEDCGEGMRIERSGDGFVIRLKCRCRLAFRVLFSHHHLYFKPL